MTRLSVKLIVVCLLLAVARGAVSRTSQLEASPLEQAQWQLGAAVVIQTGDKESGGKADANDSDAATTLDMKAIQGKWLCETSEESGKAIDRKIVKGQDQRLSIRGDKFTMMRLYAEKTGAYSGKFEIDAATGHFDFVGKGPTGKPVQWIGIYELKRDSLKLCFRYQVEGKVTRPTDFKSDDGQPNSCVFHTYRREKAVVK